MIANGRFRAAGVVTALAMFAAFSVTLGAPSHATAEPVPCGSPDQHSVTADPTQVSRGETTTVTVVVRKYPCYETEPASYDVTLYERPSGSDQREVAASGRTDCHGVVRFQLAPQVTTRYSDTPDFLAQANGPRTVEVAVTDQPPSTDSGGTSPAPDASDCPAPEPVVAPPAAKAAGVTRLSGDDRFQTAAAISRNSFPGRANDVFIVTGMDWPDALSAGPAAAAVNAPVLPVQFASIPSAILRELERLQPLRAWLIGGESVVSNNVRTDLEVLGIATQRVSGSSRYATARLVSERFFPNAQGAYYASGETYADALSGGPAAAARAWPLLLTTSQRRHPETPIIPGDRVALGGTAAISNTTLAELGARRVAGADRYATAVAVAQEAFDHADVVHLATGADFPDALAGAPAAARDAAPLLLVRRDCATEHTRRVINALGAEALVVLGGPNAVSDRAASLTPC